MRALRSVLFNILYVCWSTGIAIVYMPLLIAPRWIVQKAARVWSWGLFVLMRVCIGLKYEVRGMENVPKGGVILACKHQSAWETFVFHLLFADPIFVLKRELFWFPFVGWMMFRSGAIGVDRAKGMSALKKMLRQAKVRLEAGGRIVIFPEGTRTLAGAMEPFHPGVAMLYDNLDAPVIPVALNSGVFWGRKEFTKSPGTVIIEFLEPMPNDLKKRVFLAELHGRINDASNKLMEEAGFTLPPPSPPPDSSPSPPGPVEPGDK